MRSDMFSPIILQRSGNIREINLTDPGIRSDKYFTSEREIFFSREGFLIKIGASYRSISPNRNSFHEKMFHLFSHNGIVYLRHFDFRSQDKSITFYCVEQLCVRFRKPDERDKNL